MGSFGSSTGGWGLGLASVQIAQGGCSNLYNCRSKSHGGTGRLRGGTLRGHGGAGRLRGSTLRGPERSPTALSESKTGPQADFSTVCGASQDTFRRQRFLGVGGSGRSPLESADPRVRRVGRRWDTARGKRCSGKLRNQYRGVGAGVSSSTISSGGVLESVQLSWIFDVGTFRGTPRALLAPPGGSGEAPDSLSGSRTGRF